MQFISLCLLSTIDEILLDLDLKPVNEFKSHFTLRHSQTYSMQYTRVASSFFLKCFRNPRSFLYAMTILQTSHSLCCFTMRICHSCDSDAAPSVLPHRTGAVNDTTVVACSFSPCSQMFMTGSTYGDLRLWDLHMKQLHKENNAHDLGVTCCAFAPNILSSESH